MTNKERKKVQTLVAAIILTPIGGCMSQTSGDREMIGIGIMRDGGYKHTHIVGESNTANTYFTTSEAVKRQY